MRRLAILLILILGQLAHVAMAGERRATLAVSVQVVSGCRASLQGSRLDQSCTDTSIAPILVSTPAIGPPDPAIPAEVAATVDGAYLTIVY